MAGAKAQGLSVLFPPSIWRQASVQGWWAGQLQSLCCLLYQEIRVAWQGGQVSCCVQLLGRTEPGAGRVVQPEAWASPEKLESVD